MENGWLRWGTKSLTEERCQQAPERAYFNFQGIQWFRDSKQV